MYAISQWQKQDFVSLILPYKGSDWDNYLDEILLCYYDLAKIISKYQKVLIIAKDISLSLPLKDIKNIKIIQANYNDTWARDILPISIKKNNKISLLNFKFNGWGEKYDFWLDNELSLKIFDNTKSIDICLEGGGIDNNGDGLMLINKQSFTFNRNEIAFKKIISSLQNIFNAKILILKNGSIQGDDTNSHIDTLARFVNKNTIFYLSCNDKTNPNYKSLLKMQNDLKIISKENDLKIIPIQAPSQTYYKNSPTPATYINFIIINNAVIVPTYNDKNDKNALEIFKTHFPNRAIIGFNALVFIRQNGSLHCASANFF